MFGPERVTVAPRLDDALEAAIGQAEAEGSGAPGVLVTGSVVLVGEARSLLVTDGPADPAAPPSDPDDDWDDDVEDDEEGETEDDDPYGGFAPGGGNR